MKSLIIGLMVTASTFAFSTEKTDKGNVFLSNCMNFGTGVNYSFSSCVNSNFSTVARETNSFLSYCSNFGQEVDYSFTSCVTSNFNSVQSAMNNKVFLNYCMNFDRKTLDYSFVSCVNSNFQTIQRELNTREN